jgi:MoaA/NifB/PqqE/SkfB family radical SAM enzyme
MNIVKVEPAENYFSITWMLGKRCNYSCMYCPDMWHDNHSPHHSLETLQISWDKLHKQTKMAKLPYKISFTGGEVTANKNFLPFVKWLKENYYCKKILVSTNGSAGENYYLKLANEVSDISFSIHSEFVDENQFFNKAIKLNQVMTRPQKSFHVNIMNEWWNQERIKIYEKLLKEHDISYSINEINYSRSNRTDPILKGTYNLAT